MNSLDRVLSFLKKLAKNNDREWFDTHKDEYLACREVFEKFVQEVMDGILKFDKKIDPDTTAKSSIFRIYRDVRFSRDKTPYKTHFAASMNPGGRKSEEAGYYLHIQPGNCFAAGGVWMPPPGMLQAIRQEIDYNGARLDKIMKAADFKKYFAGLDEEDKMKTAPKGYDKDHPRIESLKNRHFLVSHTFKDKEISPKKCIEVFKAMHPLMEFLREASHKD